MISKESWIDPANRFWRYPAARFLCRFVKHTPLTPNTVTAMHTLVGLFAAYVLVLGHPFYAFLIFEFRGILDCLDGVLAREKKMFSALGRSLDSIGDSISFLGFLGAIIYIVYRDQAYEWSTFCVVSLAVGLAVVSAAAGVAYDLSRRRMTAILEGVADTYETGPLNLATWIQQKADQFFLKKVFPEWNKVLVLHENASDRTGVSQAYNVSLQSHNLAPIARATALASGDNVVLFLNMGLLAVTFVGMGLFTQVFLSALGAAIVFAALAVGNMSQAHLVLDGVRKIPLRERIIEIAKKAKLSNEGIARAVAVGLGTAFAPPPGVLTPVVILSCAVLRANFAIAYLVNWVNNPVTVIPISIFSYQLGCLILGREAQMDGFTTWLKNPEWETGLQLAETIGVPYLVGSAVCVTVVGFVTYFGILFILNRRGKK
jgi:uncharacterized protein (DUF2062 family)/phosphatidylglycerophosphate synthase